MKSNYEQNVESLDNLKIAEELMSLMANNHVHFEVEHDQIELYIGRVLVYSSSMMFELADVMDVLEALKNETK